jgi:PIN domain nuclease of toxin-antitoxin system
MVKVSVYEVKAKLSAYLDRADEESALQVLRLPPLHRDPFDRMLISQAIAGSLVLLTPDPCIAQYPVRVIW